MNHADPYHWVLKAGRVREETSKMAAVPDVTTVVVLGASGDLAKKKIYPVLWSLYKQQLIGAQTSLIGYARSKLSQADLAEKLRPFLQSKIQPGEEDLCEQFLGECQYLPGAYDQAEAFSALDAYIKELEQAKGAGAKSNRVFYLALPPTVFQSVSELIRSNCWSTTGYNRIIIEKPFGHDLESSNVLGQALAKILVEPEIYRIDHYLGKEVVQNIFHLRFANMLFSRVWNRDNIANVRIIFKENFGTQGRGGYFDKSGIIRDILQNHLLQVFCAVAMERPVSLEADAVRDEKCKLLQCTERIKLDDVRLGQYVGVAQALPDDPASTQGYRDDEGVPDDSITPTYCAIDMRVNNERWAGVPFILSAGKALDERKCEVRIQFKDLPGNLYAGAGSQRNELVMRIQPEEAVYIKMTNKSPGMSSEPTPTYLDLTYKDRFPGYNPIDAYERLILDVLKGDQKSFVRGDELEEAWKIFTPILHQIEGEKIQPHEFYPYGTASPAGTEEWIRSRDPGYVRDREGGKMWLVMGAVAGAVAGAMLALHWTKVR